MPYFKLPDGSEFGIAFGELLDLLKHLWQVKTSYLIYQNALETYTNRELAWLSLTTTKGNIIAPYTIEYDYRHVADHSAWGTVRVSEDFKFPVELISHKNDMVKRFDDDGKLGKGNRPCPRLSDFQIDGSGRPAFTIQRAFYFDQVGTNLTVDYPFLKEIRVSGESCSSVRAWDILQASVKGEPAPLASSRLANTIGIAVGVTAKDRKGRSYPLKRKRSETVAVYGGEWHVPFSFALAWSEMLKPGNELTLPNLIMQDWGHELAEELGLEVSDFEPPRPLAFCRDLARGGKPQFFFEMVSRKTLEDLRGAAGSDKSEFVGKIKAADQQIQNYSPELLAFSLLTL